MKRWKSEGKGNDHLYFCARNIDINKLGMRRGKENDLPDFSAIAMLTPINLG